MYLGSKDPEARTRLLLLQNQARSRYELIERASIPTFMFSIENRAFRVIASSGSHQATVGAGKGYRPYNTGLYIG
jgi:hypothetical protein